MSNIGKLKEYLVGSKGYLLDDKLSNGKVIMLSGTWGSGKTHFWINEIEPKLDKSIYISLYGKKSINDIENEVLSKSFFSDFFDEDIKNVSTFGNIAKNIVNIMAPKIGEKLEEAKTNLVNNLGKNALQNGNLLCFDDFERKSKDVDLNDLFGFITQLALNFKCKIVIILNSDVFEGKEKKLFADLKEKSVSKFFKFNPTSENLFEIIFNKCILDKKYKTIILNVINEFGLLNARIYENILENFQEYIEKNPAMTNQEVRYFVLTLINFNLLHIVFKFYDYSYQSLGDNFKLPTFFIDQKDLPVNLVNSLDRQSSQNRNSFKVQSELIDIIKSLISSEYKTTNEPNKKTETKPTEKLTEDLKIVDKYADIIWSYWRLETKLEYRKDIDEKSIRQMNDFIETGIL